MRYFMDFWTSSLNKTGEELCGDKVDSVQEENQFIAVLSDGLGSGVKANILATLTSKIALTMLKEGLPIEEVVDTIIHTLPICAVRKLAYSTFTIIKVDETGMAYIVEFDNPSVFFMREGKITHLEPHVREINGRIIKETHLQLKEKDMLLFVSDGVIHAGVGRVLNLGWSWTEVAHYLEEKQAQQIGAKQATLALLGACEDLYMGEPGDDTTVAAIQAIRPKNVTLFAGPPQDPKQDQSMVEAFMAKEGLKIVCGGTAANIVARELHTEVKTSFEMPNPRIPPIGYIRGVDLVTEGVLTLQATIEKLEAVKNSKSLSFLEERDGASQLAKLLLEECTHLKCFIGKAINPAHQNPDFPVDLSIKLNMLHKLVNCLRSLGKMVEIEYY